MLLVSKTFPPFLLRTELTEFVLQLDEEVEAMQAAILHLELQLQNSKDSGSGGGGGVSSSPKNTGTTSSSSKGSKERTKGTTNGSVETGSISASSSKT